MLLYGLGGRAVLDRVRRHTRGHVVERTLGAVLILTGVLMVFNVDVRFEEDLAKDTSLPSFLIDPTRSLETSNSVSEPARVAATAVSVRRAPAAGGVGHAGHQRGRRLDPRGQDPPLPKLGLAPNFTDTQDWFNTPGNRPLTMAGLRGHVVLVDFWTYTCINCIRTLPFVKGLYATYHKYGLDVVGVETPEFTFEQEAGNVRQAIQSDGIRYPVVQDNRYGTWNAYQNEYWPAEYFIDAHGQIRHTKFGEGNYKEDEAAVRAAAVRGGSKAPATADDGHRDHALHRARDARDLPRSDARPGFRAAARSKACTPTPASSNPSAERVRPEGDLERGPGQSINPVSTGDTITGRVQAGHVYLAMTSNDNRPRNVQVLLDGHPISAADSGADVHNGTVHGAGSAAVRADLVARRPAAHVHAEIPPGSAYDFTFG